MVRESLSIARAICDETEPIPSEAESRLVMNPDNIRFIGDGLQRPECALAHSSGTIFTPDWTGDGGISVILPEGRTVRHRARNWREIAGPLGFDEPLRPNGICLLDGGTFLMAHLGAERGGLFLLHPDGSVEPYVTELEGKPLPPCNFVALDRQGRCWLTVSTRRVPRALAYRKDVADGFVARIDNGKARILADNLGYTNECMVHPDGQRLFVNETFARRLTSFAIGKEGTLSNRRTVAEFGQGTFPDGLAFDKEGNAWVTSIVSNRVLRINDGGKSEIFLEDSDPGHLEWVEAAWQEDAMERAHLDRIVSSRMRNLSNLAFCGDKLDQAVFGCLLGDRLPVIDMPIPGFQLQHWTFNIDPLIRTLNEKDL